MKEIENDKHIAFLVDCPVPGQLMMFPDWLENLDMANYEEVSDNVTFSMKMRKSLIGTKYKVFKIKNT
jgi:hypothetical protein